MGHYPFRPGHSRYSIFKQAINLFYYAKNDILDEKYSSRGLYYMQHFLLQCHNKVC